MLTADELARLCTLRPLSEYHEDEGAVIWWHLPIQEPPYIGHGPGAGECNADNTPTTCAELLEDGWLTHWSPLPKCEMLIASDGTEVFSC